MMDALFNSEVGIAKSRIEDDDAGMGMNADNCGRPLEGAPQKPA